LTDNYPHFGDFAEEAKLYDGDKMRIDDVLNRVILILAYKIRDSKQKANTSYVTIQFRCADKMYILFTGSKVIAEQLTKYSSNIPFYTTIKKIDKYYTFS